MNRYLVSFFITLLLYIGLIALYLYNSQHKIETQSAKKSYTRVNITILSKKPPQKKVIKKTKKVKPKPKIEHKPKPKKIIKKIVKKSHIKKVVKKQIIKKKLKPKKIVKKKIIKKQKKIIPKQQIKQKQTKSKTGITDKDKKIIELKKQKYYKLIKEAIQSNQEYPRKAIRRGIEGDTKVDFLISKDGKLLDIRIIDGDKIFYRSTKEAIENSFPIILDSKIFTKKFNLTLTLEYHLN